MQGTEKGKGADCIVYLTGIQGGALGNYCWEKEGKERDREGFAWDAQGDATTYDRDI